LIISLTLEHWKPSSNYGKNRNSASQKIVVS